jgi:hypothetical protein
MFGRTGKVVLLLLSILAIEGILLMVGLVYFYIVLGNYVRDALRTQEIVQGGLALDITLTVAIPALAVLALALAVLIVATFRWDTTRGMTGREQRLALLLEGALWLLGFPVAWLLARWHLRLVLGFDHESLGDGALIIVVPVMAVLSLLVPAGFRWRTHRF